MSLSFSQQDKESDNNLIQRLITDIAGGGLRRQKAAAETGLMIDDIDLYDEDNDLIAIRRAAEARRRKLLKQKGGDVLENLLNDPKTAAFAKAAQAIPDESLIAFLSESEPDEEEEENESQDENGDFMSLRDKNRIIIEEDVEDEDEDEDEEENDIEVMQDVSRQIKDDDALMDDISDDENFVIVDGFNTNNSSLQEGIVNNAA
ncbi:MAG: hypothetical protein EXX96DRAFT_79974 [Benjaminiella poitrasii]|nr:MAG: hypothetical protein EXX96DRAFT_79974 [Benjaminiella poitrasii]